MLKTMRDDALTEAQDARPGGETEDRDRVSVGGAVARICLLVVLLLVVNVLPEGLGISLTRTEAGQWIVRPLLQTSPSWLNLWLTLSLALWVVNLYLRRWNPTTRWAELGLNVLAAFVLLQLFKGVLPAVSGMHVLLQPGQAQTTLARIVEDPSAWAMLAASVLLPIALLYALWESARRLLVLARPKRG